ncbi:uncharacterized protein EV422DRAFT_604939 [Fimicolochytrium jonesii]|uniref:uncharacterized protein n=1 Tax=Fimicolochytrium jonesii TaxID=1396493 RepID=UPI0022FE418A|nr:uncharacterized protein EV422DRAFT_604939 [Fimicolochytrium jonesii]KAI8817288.1 hypothetical protein EV422DRAFT_604939 [Fimicolochytrium jonesii]
MWMRPATRRFGYAKGATVRRASWSSLQIAPNLRVSVTRSGLPTDVRALHDRDEASPAQVTNPLSDMTEITIKTARAPRNSISKPTAHHPTNQADLNRSPPNLLRHEPSTGSSKPASESGRAPSLCLREPEKATPTATVRETQPDVQIEPASTVIRTLRGVSESTTTTTEIQTGTATSAVTVRPTETESASTVTCSHPRLQIAARLRIAAAPRSFINGAARKGARPSRGALSPGGVTGSLSVTVTVSAGPGSVTLGVEAGWDTVVVEARSVDTETLPTRDRKYAAMVLSISRTAMSRKRGPRIWVALSLACATSTLPASGRHCYDGGHRGAAEPSSAGPVVTIKAERHQAEMYRGIFAADGVARAFFWHESSGSSGVAYSMRNEAASVSLTRYLLQSLAWQGGCRMSELTLLPIGSRHKG